MKQHRNGGNYMTRSFINYALRLVLLRRLNQQRQWTRSMQHAWENERSAYKTLFRKFQTKALLGKPQK